MKSFIVLTTLIALVSAQDWRNLPTFNNKPILPPRSEQPEWFSTSRLTYVYRLLRASENDYLSVCSTAVSKNTETNVQQTLQTAGTNMQVLSQAMDHDDTSKLLQAVKDASNTIRSDIAAIQGTVFAAIQDKVKGGLTGDQKRCLQRVLGELGLLFDDLKLVQEQTKEAVTDFKQETTNEAFLQYFKQLSDLMTQVDQFIQDPSQTSRLQSACQSVKPSQVIEQVVNTLKTMKPQMQTADELVKRNSIESVTGLLVQGVTLNAICRAGQNVDENDQVQESRMQNDGKQTENLYNTLNSLAKDIFGQVSFFRRMFGY